MKPEQLLNTQDPAEWGKHFINSARDTIGGRGMRVVDLEFVKNWFHHALQAGKNFADGPDSPIILTANETGDRLATVLQEVQTLRREVKQFMKTLADVLTDVQAEKTQIDSLVALVAGLKGQVNSVPGLTPDQQAQIDEIFAAVEANKQEVADAVTANTAAAVPSASSGA